MIDASYFHLFYIWLSINSWNFQTSDFFGRHSCYELFLFNQRLLPICFFWHPFLIVKYPFTFTIFIQTNYPGFGMMYLFLFGCYFRFEFEYWNAMLEVFNIISRDHFHQYMERVDLLWISIERNLWV